MTTPRIPGTETAPLTSSDYRDKGVKAFSSFVKPIFSAATMGATDGDTSKLQKAFEDEQPFDMAKHQDLYNRFIAGHDPGDVAMEHGVRDHLASQDQGTDWQNAPPPNLGSDVNTDAVPAPGSLEGNSQLTNMAANPAMRASAASGQYGGGDMGRPQNTSAPYLKPMRPSSDFTRKDFEDFQKVAPYLSKEDLYQKQIAQANQRATTAETVAGINRGGKSDVANIQAGASDRRSANKLEGTKYTADQSFKGKVAAAKIGQEWHHYHDDIQSAIATAKNARISGSDAMNAQKILLQFHTKAMEMRNRLATSMDSQGDETPPPEIATQQKKIEDDIIRVAPQVETALRTLQKKMEQGPSQNLSTSETSTATGVAARPGGKTVTRRQVNRKLNKTRITYSDGSTEEVNGIQ